MKIPELLLDEWRDLKARVLPGAEAAQVREAFGKIGMHVSSDVLALYQAIGGMEIPDDREWRLWSLAEIEAQNNGQPAFGAEFSDYLIGCWSFRVRPINPHVSEVYIDYADGQSPVRAAASLEEFLEVMDTDPLRVLDPGAHRRLKR
jgi:hypothetical protein